MDSTDFQALINTLGEQLVLVDATDLPALATMHTTLEGVRDWMRAQGAPRATAATEACIDLIANVILEEASQPEALLALVAEAAGALQGFGAHTDDELDFPAALGVPKATRRQASPPLSPLGEMPTQIRPLQYTPPSYVDAEILGEFLARQGQVLDELEQAALALESEDASWSVAELRRILHSLKGEAALLGLTEVERLCHAAEDAVVTHPGAVQVDNLLAMKDWLRRVFDAVAGTSPDPGPPLALLERFAAATQLALPEAVLPTPAEDAEQGMFALLDGPDAPECTPLIGDRALLAAFVLEAREHLQNAELHLLRLETDASNQDAMKAVFRAIGSINGVSDFLSLGGMVELAAAAAQMLERACNRELSLQEASLDLLVECVGALKDAVEEVNRALGGDGLLPEFPQFRFLAERIGVALDSVSPAAAVSSEPLPATAAKLGDILVAHQAVAPESIQRALDQQRAPQPEPLGMVLRQASVISAETMRTALEIQASERPGTPIGEILIGMGTASPEEVDDALSLQQAGGNPARLGEVLVASGDASPGAVRHALRKQRAGAEAQGSTGAITVRESVKVDALRLDQLVDMIGELVIAETMVTQSPEVLRLASPTLRRRVRQLEKISRDLQTMATSLRMVPVRATFQKMARLVRDVARKTGKAVEFHLSGEETELDKSVVDKISDPLVHLLRNAVDHGIEDRAELRSAAGKAPVGNIHLRAYHKGGSIQIEIEDDGRGLNRGAIVRKAIEQGLITQEEHLSDREVWNLIFEPGFSTAGKLTELSGRGVGMDVVRRNIMALRGEIDIHSEAGRGCRFTISLPLTLAIIDGMVIRVGKERFIVPTLSIVISVRPRAEDLHTVARRGEMVSVRGQLLTLYRLGRVLNIPDAIDEPTKGTVMVVEHEGRQVGLLIDQILGQQQIVIKPLGEYLRGAPGLSGGAIMPDGNVGLVLDIAGLVELAGRLAPAPTSNEVTAWAMAHATGDKAYE